MKLKGSNRLEDRIQILVEKAVGVQNSDELEDVITELRAALKEHAERMRKLASSKRADPDRRKND